MFGKQLRSEALDLMETGQVIPPSEASPSVRKQLTYLNTRKGGSEAMSNAGIPARTRRGWPTRTPSAASRERIEQAYWALRAANWRRTGRDLPPHIRQAIAPQLTERARGKRMTIVPIDPRDVDERAQGAQSLVSEREIRPSQQSWNGLIGAWGSDDETELDTAWMSFAEEIDSPPEGYYETDHIGFSL